jgi:type I restriction enzyme S subunit
MWWESEAAGRTFPLHALRYSGPFRLSVASGAIHKTLYMPALKDLYVCLPDRLAQDALAARLDDQLAAAATVLASARAELKTIEALPAAVLRRDFS